MNAIAKLAARVNEPARKDTRRALVVLPGGGFSFESRCLLPRLAETLQFVYLVTEFGGRPGEAGLPPGRAYRVPSFASFTHRSTGASVRAFVATLLVSLKLLRSERIDVVLALGCSHSVPMLLAARLRGARGIFVESLARADRLSNTGRLVYHCRLADKFIVQWPQLARRYRRAETGTIL